MSHTGAERRFIIPYIVVLIGSNFFFAGMVGRVGWALVQIVDDLSDPVVRDAPQAAAVVPLVQRAAAAGDEVHDAPEPLPHDDPPARLNFASACARRSHYARAVLARLWHGAIAILVAVALAIQTGIAVRAPGTPEAHDVGTLAGTIAVGRLVRMLSFFTIQSNILCAVDLAAAGARLLIATGGCGASPDSMRWSASPSPASSTRPCWRACTSRHGWEQVSTNIVFHYVVPLMMVLGWVFFGPGRGSIRTRCAGRLRGRWPGSGTRSRTARRRTGTRIRSSTRPHTATGES